MRADGEQQVDVFAGLAVKAFGLLRAQQLPGFDGLTDTGIDGLGEGGAGLVDGDVEQADSVRREDFFGVSGDRVAVLLPADATDAQAGDLVAA